MANNVQVQDNPLGCASCAVSLVGLIVTVWVLTHISVIWHILDRAIR